MFTKFGLTRDLIQLNHGHVMMWYSELVEAAQGPIVMAMGNLWVFLYPSIPVSI